MEAGSLTLMSEVMEVERLLSPPQHTTSPKERTAQNEVPEEVKKTTGGVPETDEGGAGELPQHTTPQDPVMPQPPGVEVAPWVSATSRNLVEDGGGGMNAVGPPQVTLPSTAREHQAPPPPTNTPLEVELASTTLGEVESPPQHVTLPTLSRAQG